MEMWKVYVKRSVPSASYLIEDLGIDIPATGYVELSNQFSYSEIADSDDLRVSVSAGVLILNNGIDDFPAPSGAAYLKIDNIYHLEGNYYSKLELQTSGEAQVHWDNITNAPYIPSAIPSAANTLDDAYDEGGPGAGRTIYVDSGSVQLTASNGYSPLELTELSALPTVDLAGGQLAVKDGILYAYDAFRSKWLSTQRMFLAFGKAGNAKNQYLYHLAGPSNNSGYRLARNATVVSITAQLDSSGTCDIHIRSNDSITNLITLSLTAQLGAQDTNIDYDFTAGDYLQAYLATTGAPSQDPLTIIEIAWRE